MGIIVGEEGKDLESERKVCCNRETSEGNVSYDCNFGVVIKIETQRKSEMNDRLRNRTFKVFRSVIISNEE
jgi:hypothetical protein